MRKGHLRMRGLKAVYIAYLDNAKSC